MIEILSCSKITINSTTGFHIWKKTRLLKGNYLIIVFRNVGSRFNVFSSGDHVLQMSEGEATHIILNYDTNFVYMDKGSWNGLNTALAKRKAYQNSHDCRRQFVSGRSNLEREDFEIFR